MLGNGGVDSLPVETLQIALHFFDLEKKVDFVLLLVSLQPQDQRVIQDTDFVGHHEVLRKLAFVFLANFSAETFPQRPTAGCDNHTE